MKTQMQISQFVQELARHQKEKIERLNKIAEKHYEKPELVDNTLQYAQHHKNKALNQLNQDVSTKNKQIYGKQNSQDKGTLT